MSRCKACDWSPHTKSAYNEQVCAGSGQKRLIADPETGDSYCNACYDAITYTVKVSKVSDFWSRKDWS